MQGLDSLSPKVSVLFQVRVFAPSQNGTNYPVDSARLPSAPMLGQVVQSSEVANLNGLSIGFYLKLCPREQKRWLEVWQFPPCISAHQSSSILDLTRLSERNFPFQPASGEEV